MLFTILFILWILVGALGFVYWWTKEFDLTIGNLLLSIILGIVGPLTWIIGLYIHGNGFNFSKVIIKQRKNN